MTERDLYKNREKNRYGILGPFVDFLSDWFTVFMCLMKTYILPDDNHSGIVLPDGTTKTVYLGNNGEYFWLDDDGNRHILNDEELDQSTWTNINQIHFKTTEHCYLDANGIEVKMYRFEGLNKDNKVLLLSYEIIDSTDSSVYTVGDKLNSLPDGLVAKDCYLPDMEQRSVVHVPLRSYIIDGHSYINVTGEELFDHKLNLIFGRYYIINSNDPMYPLGQILTSDDLRNFGAVINANMLVDPSAVFTITRDMCYVDASDNLVKFTYTERATSRGGVFHQEYYVSYSDSPSYTVGQHSHPNTLRQVNCT